MTWPEKARKFFAEVIAPKAAKLEGKADNALPDRVRGVRIPRARYLAALALLVIFVVGYWRGWHKRFVKPDPSFVAVATQGGAGEEVYRGDQTPAMEKAVRRGRVKPATTVRPIVAIPVSELPREEQEKAPDVPPAVGPDNVVRELQLLDTQVVPPSRGETHARAYLYPDGATKIFQDPQREKFWGWPWKNGNWKRLELEGRYGLIGQTAIKGTARWLPLRMGNFQVGPEASVAAETEGVIRGDVMMMLRWEPFRDSYR